MQAHQPTRPEATDTSSGIRQVSLNETLFLTCKTDAALAASADVQALQIEKGGPLLFSVAFLCHVDGQDPEATSRSRRALKWVYQKMRQTPGTKITLVLFVPHDVSQDPLLASLTTKEITQYLEGAAGLLRLHFCAHHFKVETSFDRTAHQALTATAANDA